MNTQIIVAIIGGIFSLLAAVSREIVKDWLDRRRELSKPAPVQEPILKDRKAINWRTPALWTLAGTIIGYAIGLTFTGSPQNPGPVSNTAPTPIPRGALVLEINFDQSGDGNCNAYDDDLLGYENRQYYINPQPNGYIAVCHTNDALPSQGSLEVDAWSDGEFKDIYGYAVVFGWQGAGLETTDLCMMGIRRMGTVTQAFYSQRKAGERVAYTLDQQSIALDTARHNLRVALYPDGKAYGYLDERLFAVYQFENCSQGPVGMLAWGSGGQKIYFDDLKLFGLP